MPAFAQDEPAPPPTARAESAAADAAPAGDPAVLLIKTYTPVEIEFVTEISSEEAVIDQTFAIQLSRPITVDGVEVVPAGAMGEGQVAHAARRGWGGKPDETYFVRCAIGMGVMSGRAQVSPSTREEFVGRAKKMKLWEPKADKAK